MDFTTNNKQRISQAERDANDGKWYKTQADLLDTQSFSGASFLGFGGISEYSRKKVNYDLFNNILNVKEFEYVCKPFGANTGELPANFTNRDIISGKIKVLLGMEMKMPFAWRVTAVNEEATTRKEQEEAKRIRDFVNAEIVRPIKLDIQKQAALANKGKQLTPQEEEQVQQQVEQETKAATPDEVRKYMLREHQDPAEIMYHQILEYLIQKERIADKFNKGFKHTNISGEEIYYVGISNGEPVLRVTNTLFFDYDKSPDLDFIEDGEWAVCEYRMTPSEVVANFGSQLKDTEIDRIYQLGNNPSNIRDSDFTFDLNSPNEAYTIRVKHLVWKSLRKIGFLTYMKDGKEQMDIVDENYKLNKEQGDIKIDWDYIPEAHETYKILNDVYVYMRPVPGQNKDLDNLYNCKLPYYGASCDSLNSPTTSPMDRMKSYQYFYDVLLYRIELLMASDKGKILAANINAVPKSAGIDTAKFQYFMEANKIAWLNPQEEGNRGGHGGDVTNLVKEIDMSLASQINNYIQLAEYIERKCGESIGITKQMEGAIGPDEAVSNTRQNLVQSSHIIQPYFELHNTVKGNVLTALMETAKVAYATGRPRKLSYILDDMSIKTLTVDQSLLSGSTMGLFIANSSKAADAKQAVENLAQAAMQNQQATLLDIIKIIRSESVTEAEELLATAAQKASEDAQAANEAKMQHEKDLDAREDKRAEIQHGYDVELAITKEEERRKTVIHQQTILSAGFDPNKDEDDDGQIDVLEIAKHGVDADIKMRKQALDEKKFDHQKETDAEKLKLEKKKLNQKPVGK